MSYYCTHSINAEDVFSDVPFFDKYISSTFYIRKKIAPDIVLVEIEIYRGFKTGQLKLKQRNKEFICGLLKENGSFYIFPFLSDYHQNSLSMSQNKIKELEETPGLLERLAEIESECFQQLRELIEFHNKGENE